jgi:hypothetical protein
MMSNSYDLEWQMQHAVASRHATATRSRPATLAAHGDNAASWREIFRRGRRLLAWQSGDGDRAARLVGGPTVPKGSR